MKTEHRIASFVMVILFGTFVLMAERKSPLSNEDTPFCGTSILHEKHLNSSSAYQERHASQEKGYQQFITGPKANNAYVLPVVVHIVHDNEEENISESQVLQGIEWLNEAFANIGYYDQNTGVNTNIQFCLARRTPDEQETSGINRIQSPLTEMEMESDDLLLKNLIRWQPEDYINIWVVREICSESLGCGVLGYAFYPSAHGTDVDGIVVEANWFGSDEAKNTVLTHEMGHYLGLYHTFKGGCGNNDCTTFGDRVCDTPPDQSTVSVSCGESVNSCTSDTDSGYTEDQEDMYWNYMDYGALVCYSAFTQGQADRMAFFIEGSRSSLLESKACNLPCYSPLEAAFIPEALSVEIGGDLFFENTSQNATAFQWLLNGEFYSSNVDVTIPFNEQGDFEITLIAENEDENCVGEYTVSIQVYCPVQSSFTSDNYYPQPGDTIVFTSTAVESISLEWQLDGNVVSSAESMDLIFPEEGIFQVCLEAQGVYCADVFCFDVSVNASYEDCLNEPFVKTFGHPTLVDTPGGFLPSGDGNFYMWGATGNAFVLFKINLLGDIIWQRKIPVLIAPMQFVNDVIIDEQGMILGVGGGNFGGIQGATYYFKYDPIADELLWSKRMTIKVFGKNIFQIPGELDYLITCNYLTGGAEPVIKGGTLKVKGETGELVWPEEIKVYSNASLVPPGETDLLFESATLSGDYIYTTGSTNNKIALVKMDFEGQVAWSKAYDVTGLIAADNLEAKDILIENNACFIIGANESDNQQEKGLIFVKTNLEGDIVWHKRFYLPGSIQKEINEIRSVADGFLIYGTKSNQTILLKTDKEGQLIWSKKYYFSAGKHVEKQIISIQDNIFFGAVENDDFLLVKTDAEGHLGEKCGFVRELNLLDITAAGDVASMHIAVTNTNYEPNFLPDGLEQPEEINYVPSNIGNCGCEEPITSCDSTYVKLFGSPGEDVVLKSFHKSGDPAQFTFAGGKGDSSLILLTDVDGQVLETTTLDMVEGKEVINSIKGAPGVGSSFSEEGERNDFWFFHLGNEFGVRIRSNPDEKLTINSINDFGNLGAIINEDTGDKNIVIASNNFNEFRGQMFNGKEELFSGSEIENSFFSVLVGSLQHDETDDSTTRGLMVIWNGQQFYSPRSYFVPPGEPAWIVTKDIIENDGILTLSHGNLYGADPSDSELILAWLDYDGEVLWVKRYNLPEGINERAVHLLNLPFNYIITGEYEVNGHRDFFVISTDKQGNVQWAKSFGGEADDTIEAVQVSGRFLYILGNTKSFNDNQNSEAIFIKLPLDGMAISGCNAFRSLEVEQNVFENAYSEVVEFQNGSFSEDFDYSLRFSSESSLGNSELCILPCCESLPDIFIKEMTPECGGDSLLLQVEVCNGNAGAVLKNTPIAVYGSNPTETNTAILATAHLPEIILKDSCFVLEITVPSTLEPLYVVVNDNGTIDRPYDLQEELPNPVFLECDFSNNMDSLILDYESETLNLGPDTLMCDNGVVTLDASDKYYKYRWQDGSDGQTFTTWNPGKFWVEVTDSCGGVQVDTVEVSVLPASVLDVGPDTIVCELTELKFNLGGFDSYTWSPVDYLDCSNCSEVTIIPEASITYIVEGKRAPGCYSRDTFHVEVIPNNLELNLPQDTTIQLGDPYAISVTTNANGIQDLMWMPENWLSCVGCLEPLATPLESTTYVLQLTDENNCQITADFRLNVNDEPRMFIPSAFSPNGDKINDVLEIFGGPDVVEILEFQIFDRWGGLIFEKQNFKPNDPINGWDGTFKGKKLNAGVYVYYARVLFLNGKEEVLKGDVTLMR